MEVKGDVYWIEFKQITPPDNKEVYDRRPVVVLHVDSENVIVGMLTTKDYTDRGAVKITPQDYAIGGSREIHYFRPDRITTDHRDWLDDHVGRLKPAKIAECVAAVTRLLGG
jgi:mRNA-degrading endonuclease toxin of MazEF toxin-antitoxin module